MKIRMLMDVEGTFHGQDGGVKRGDVVDVDKESADNYIKLGYAEKATGKDGPADEAQLLQVATRSSEYVTVAEAESKAEEAAADEAAAVNTPEPNAGEAPPAN